MNITSTRFSIRLPTLLALSLYILTAVPLAAETIHEAARAGSISKFVTLLELFPNFRDQVDSDGNTAMHEACKFRRLEIVALLISKGASPNKLNAYRLTPLWIACSKGDFELVEFLLANGADPNITNGVGRTPLFAAVSIGHKELVVTLLKHGANASQTDSQGKTAKDFSGYDSELVELCERNWDSEMTKALGVTVKEPAATAASTTITDMILHGQRDAVARLLQADSKQVNVLDATGDTPLHCAVRHNQERIVETLLAFSANPTIKNKFGLTPLDLAKGYKRESILLILNLAVVANQTVTVNHNSAPPPDEDNPPPSTPSFPPADKPPPYLNKTNISFWDKIKSGISEFWEKHGDTVIAIGSQLVLDYVLQNSDWGKSQIEDYSDNNLSQLPDSQFQLTEEKTFPTLNRLFVEKNRRHSAAPLPYYPFQSQPGPLIRAPIPNQRTYIFGSGGRPVGYIADTKNSIVFNSNGSIDRRFLFQNDSMIEYTGKGVLAGRHQIQGTSVRSYNADGTLRGTSMSLPNSKTIIIYGSRGELVGRSQTQGNTIITYDSKGALTGRTVPFGDSYLHYNAKGQLTGRMQQN